MLELYNGPLEVENITNRWYEIYKEKNYGVLITFIGIVRSEDEIEGLSFDIYRPLLKTWFHDWQEKAKEANAVVLMAHSFGDVKNHRSSYIAGVCSPQRRVALNLIDSFVEDFKRNAPIWKYDLIKSKRVYAQSRSNNITGSGLLA